MPPSRHPTLAYHKYLWMHKTAVLRECLKRGVARRGLWHDLSKYRPREFLPYRDHFYGDFPERRPVMHPYEGADARTKADVAREFDYAWLHHIHANDHHWQFWVLREDDGQTKLLPMGHDAMLEMVCDWVGAGQAICAVRGVRWTPDATKEWYARSKPHRLLAEPTLAHVEAILGA